MDPSRAAEGVDEPVLRRLEKLQEQYRAFIAEAGARVLLWRFEQDERRMLDAFVQHNAVTAGTGDAILQVPSPFNVRPEHGIVIVHDLSELFDAVAEAVGNSGPPQPEWIPPRPPQSLARQGVAPPDQQYLVKALGSLHEHMQPQAKHLVLALAPRAVENPGEWYGWLSDLVPQLDDERLRLIVPYFESERALLSGSARYTPRVMVTEAALDMPAAYEEIARKAPDSELPAGQFRLQFIKLGRAVSKKDLAGARAEAAPALVIARAQNWPHLEFAVQQALGSGELGLGDPQAAMATFARADEAASRAVAAGNEWAEPLMLQARLGMGAVAVTVGAWPLGARLYGQEAEPVAAKTGEKLAELDCVRMAAYCEERAGDFEPAWQHLTRGLAIGFELAQAEREASTLAFVGQAMLRIAASVNRYAGYRDGVEEQMRRMLGPDWRARAAPQSQPPPDGSGSAVPLESMPPPKGLPSAALPPKGEGDDA